MKTTLALEMHGHRTGSSAQLRQRMPYAATPKLLLTCLVTSVPPSILAASAGASSALLMCTPPCREGATD